MKNDTFVPSQTFKREFFSEEKSLFISSKTIWGVPQDLYPVRPQLGYVLPYNNTFQSYQLYSSV